MIATIADSGMYHTPHVIKSGIIRGQSVTPAKITSARCSPRPGRGRGLGRCRQDTVGGGTAAGRGWTTARPDHRQDRHHQPVPVGVLHRRRSRSTRWSSPCSSTSRMPAEERPCSSTAALAFAPPAGIRPVRRRRPGRLRRALPGQHLARVPQTRSSATARGAFPPVNNDGQLWNLYRRAAQAQAEAPPAGPRAPGPGHRGKGSGKVGRARTAAGSPRRPGTPPPPGTRRRPATPTPTGHPTPTGPHFATGAEPTRPGGGPGAGAVALALVVVAGPSLPLVTRLRNRRSRRSPERPLGG